MNEFALAFAGLCALLAGIAYVRSAYDQSVPLLRGPVLGWRAWRVDPAANLCSLVSGHRLPLTAQSAVCDPGKAPDKRLHTAPGQRCECGLHALSSYELARRAVAHTERWERRAVDLLIVLAFGLVHVGALPMLVALVVFRQARRRGIVYGVVALSGSVALDPVSGGVQLRAERSRLLALMESPWSALAAERYGVPLVARRWIVGHATELSGATPIDPWCLGRGPRDSARALAVWVASVAAPLLARAIPIRGLEAR